MPTCDFPGDRTPGQVPQWLCRRAAGDGGPQRLSQREPQNLWHGRQTEPRPRNTLRPAHIPLWGLLATWHSAAVAWLQEQQPCIRPSSSTYRHDIFITPRLVQSNIQAVVSGHEADRQDRHFVSYWPHVCQPHVWVIQAVHGLRVSELIHLQTNVHRNRTHS